MNRRIVGIDVARALAVIGMIIVNFKVVFGEEGTIWIKSFAGIFEGKAAATFVTLAGVGIALTTKKSIKSNNIENLKIARKRVIKRAFFLFILGISYINIWPADILHFYGIYMVIVLLLLKSSGKLILFSGTLLILIYPLLMMIWSYETGWNFESLSYQDFWSIKGFLRNLFYNGFHPVIPWTAFMIFGYWLGMQDLQNRKYMKRLFFYSLIVFIFLHIISLALINLLSDGSQEVTKELTDILGTNPMPPLPMYMFNGISIAFTVISGAILIGEKYGNNKIVDALNKTGQLALTFYVAHVVIGMGIVEIFGSKKLGEYSVSFSVGYALFFSLTCIVFAVYWLKNRSIGPIEWVMKKLIK
ncbi:MAG: hypothetical protein CR982_01975 [Candidatus Cloacimonadota bacterium]|nr:MAG: hypothetical protein CR982_01975 [Candidatus Cloacimonadota bacterium]PIE78947.1 MAG: hypothetical protein CSA15_05215 [Candidatus Delongbacteria bacterium]